VLTDVRIGCSGHKDLLARLEKGLESTPGLFLGGNYRTGVALGDCVQFGVTVADGVDKYLTRITTL
jgi:oxygen-dependent protoporphyrinogen oxidase